jgi:hypothetical protein
MGNLELMMPTHADLSLIPLLLWSTDELLILARNAS